MALSSKFFAPLDKIEERSIEMMDGTTEVVWLKHLPNTMFERYAIWSNSADEDVVATASARLVAAGVCEPDGKPSLTQEEAEHIERPVFQRLVRAVLEVNGYGKQAEKLPAGNP